MPKNRNFLFCSNRNFSHCRDTVGVVGRSGRLLCYTAAMANIDHYSPGSFCWFELGTTDQNAAKSFHKALFGWGADDMPMGPEGVYTMFTLEGRNTGAAYTLMRSEEHTSELQSLRHLVCRLLLE